MKILIPVFACLLTMTSCAPQYKLYVGTFTTATNQSDGIYVNNFNSKHGTIHPVAHSEKIISPSYLALTKDQKFLYTVNDNSERKGAVTAFAVNGKKGLIMLNSQLSMGDGACHIAVDQTNRFVAAANYSSGNFAVFGINADGSLTPALQTMAHLKEGKPGAARAHQVVFSHDNRFLYVVDLGVDSVFQYQFSANNQKPVGLYKSYGVAAGSGPRHLVINPAGTFIYLLNEWKSYITTFRVENDQLIDVQSIETGAVPGPGGNMGSAAIRISPDGRFVYASNRGNTNTVSTFEVLADGRLKMLNAIPVDKHPRDINISPDGKWLLVASRDDNSVKVYVRDLQTGLLKFAGTEIHFPSPVSLLFGK